MSARKCTITAEELLKHVENLRATVPDRPKGFYTVDEMSWELVDAGLIQNYTAAKSRIDRVIKVLHHQKRLARMQVMSEGPTGKVTPCTAFKILPEGK